MVLVGMGMGGARDLAKWCLFLGMGAGAGGAGSPLVWLEGFVAADFAAVEDSGGGCGGGHDSMESGGAKQNHRPRTVPR